jgi:ABC-2 type transport system permease protein
MLPASHFAGAHFSGGDRAAGQLGAGRSMRSSRHRLFSFPRVLAITGNTLTGLVRLKVFYVLLFFALLVIGASFFMAQMTFQQEFQVLKDIALGAMSMFTSLLAIIATARLLPRDIEDRTAYTILAKPVSRFEYLAGKLLGVLSLLALSLVAMSALFFLVVTVREQSVLTETARQMSGAPTEQSAEALRLIRANAFHPNLFSGIAIIYVKGCLLASLTLLVSTFASSTIFSTVVMAFVYFVGHLEGIAREYWLQANGADWITKTFVAFVALIFPDLQLFSLADDVGAGNAIPLALLLRTVGLGLFYTGFYFLVAWAVFFRKEL